MKIRIALLLTAIAMLTSGCAPMRQAPLNLEPTAVGSQAGRIGVAMGPLPKLDTDFPGAGCLLCLAAASLANSSLTSHVQTLSYEDLAKLKYDVAELLRKRGADVSVIEEELKLDTLSDYGTKAQNIASKDFSPLQQKYRIDKLLVIDITALGFIRTYSAYIPTSDPKGRLQGTGYIVNLKNNAYEWYLPVAVTKSAGEKWDEPPRFPGLTNAYYQALEIGRDSFLQPFAGKALTAAGPTPSSLAQSTAQAHPR